MTNSKFCRSGDCLLKISIQHVQMRWVFVFFCFLVRSHSTRQKLWKMFENLGLAVEEEFAPRWFWVFRYEKIFRNVHNFFAHYTNVLDIIKTLQLFQLSLVLRYRICSVKRQAAEQMFPLNNAHLSACRLLPLLNSFPLFSNCTRYFITLKFLEIYVLHFFLCFIAHTRNFCCCCCTNPHTWDVKSLQTRLLRILQDG